MRIVIKIVLVSILSLISTIHIKAFVFQPIHVEAQKWVKGNKSIPWQFFATATVDHLQGYQQKADTLLNAYGSSLELTSDRPASGFFRTEKIGNRWWLVDPLGCLHIQKVINGFRQGGSSQNKKAFDQKFASPQEWVEKSAKDFRSFGFNGTGAWSEEGLIDRYNRQNEQQLTHCIQLGLMTKYGKKRGGTYQLPGNIGFPNQTIFVFDPEFEPFCDSLLNAMQFQKQDRSLIGYFSDNELPLGLKNLEGYLNLNNPLDPGRLAAERWLREKGVTPDKISDKERAGFAGYVADTYYEKCRRVISKHAPNHLYLGSRLHGQAKFIPSVLKAAGRYCDIVSINYYGVWTPSAKHLSDWECYTGKPFIVTEFYTKAMDSGLANTTGAGFTVKTQKDRGYAYQNFCLSLLSSPSCVGWHFFKYQDNDPTAKDVDPSNVDSNKGVVDNRYNYYKDMVELMTQLNRQVFNLINYMDKDSNY